MSTSKVNGLPGGESQRGQSHAVEAGSIGRCVRWAVLQDLRDMAKARLLEPQFPAMKCASLDYRISTARPSDLANTMFVGKGLPTDGRRVMNPLKGTKRVPKSRVMFLMRKRGIAYRARALWQRSLRSSPRTGKPSTWRREAGVQGNRMQRYAKCRQPK
jgi:hypothetical protein